MAADGDPFGGLTQEQLNALMEEDARRVWGNQPRGLPAAQENRVRQPAQLAPRVAPQAQATHGVAQQMFNDHGDSFAYGGFNSAMAGAAEANANAQSAANNVMAAIQRENDSRVAQSREMRRMAHEKEMEQMRINALLQRLDMERKAAPSNGLPGFSYDDKTGSWSRL